MLIGVMTENNSGQEASASDLANWADDYGLTHPMANSSAQVAFVVSGYPTYVVIDREMTITNADLWPFDENEIEDVVYGR